MKTCHPNHVRGAVALLALALLPLFPTGCGQGGGTDGNGVIRAKLASEEIEGDFMTVWGERFAGHMAEFSDGKLDIEVYPYGSLGDTRDINELTQLGVVEFVFTDFAWISSFVPEAQVLALHYVWPRENTAEVLDWVVNHGEFMPQLEAAFRRKKLVPLSIMFEGWQWLTSKSPADSLEALQGMKVRLMGSKILVENYRRYGISPTPMGYGEVYSALQTGLIDAQVNPLFANYSMKFYEVTDHFTQMWAEPFLSIPTVNSSFYDSLSPELQQEMKNYFRRHIIESAEWIEQRNAADRASMVEEMPDITWTEWPDEEVARARSAVQPVRTEVYPGLVGSEAGALLDTLLDDIEQAKQAVAAADNNEG